MCVSLNLSPEPTSSFQRAGSLGLTSKDMLCYSVKMIYASIYAQFLSFALQINCELALTFNLFRACCHITLSSRETSPRTTRCTSLRVSLCSVPLHAQKGSAKGSSLQQTNTIEGYHCLFEFLWYFLLLFFSSQFITVLAISVLISLCYLQPWHPWDLIVIVVIWCMSFSANKL